MILKCGIHKMKIIYLLTSNFMLSISKNKLISLNFIIILKIYPKYNI